jgi:hypothetical protein
VEQEFVVRYTVTYERVVKSVGLQAAAERARRSLEHIKGSRLVMVYDPKLVTMEPIA